MPSKSTTTPSVSQNDVSDLRADARRDQRKIRDLENQLAVLSAEIQSGKKKNEVRYVMGEPVPVAPLTPATATPAPSDAIRSEDIEYAGIDDSGNEIIYAGDAASEAKTVITLHGSGSPRRSRPSDNFDDVPLEIRQGRGEIPVTSGNVPTVDQQIRRARSAPIPSRKSEDARTEYERYYLALKAGNHAYATAGFRNFVKQHPEHDFADNAQYWLGEAFYDQKDFAGAIIEFRTVVEKFPKGNKVPDALLKLGYCYGQLSQNNLARQALSRVVAEFPKTEPASLAEQKLSQLGVTE